MADPALPIAQALEAAGYGTLGVNLFACPELDDDAVPANAIFVFSYDGGGILDTFAGTRTDEVFVQALIRRSEGFDPGEGDPLDIRDDLHHAAIGGLTGVFVRSSVYLGRSAGRHRWTINLGAWVAT